MIVYLSMLEGTMAFQLHKYGWRGAKQYFNYWKRNTSIDGDNDDDDELLMIKDSDPNLIIFFVVLFRWILFFIIVHRFIIYLYV